jgi:hypothetical protein
VVCDVESGRVHYDNFNGRWGDGCMNLLITTAGTVRCTYNETIDLSTIGPLTIQRGSHVEPDSDGCWWADLCPVDGPHLGPFHTRSGALNTELDWLNAHWLTTLS